MIRKNEIPKEYTGQIVNFFAVNEELEKLYFIGFNPASKLMKSFIVEVTRDSQLIVKETKKEGIVKCLVSDLVIELNKNVDEIKSAIHSSMFGFIIVNHYTLENR